MKKQLHKLHEIVASPEYQGQDIHLDTNDDAEGSHSYADRIFATVKLNDMYDMKMKVDTGADTCTYYCIVWHSRGPATSAIYTWNQAMLCNAERLWWRQAT